MILVGQYDSPYVRRVAVALHIYAMPFTRNTTSVFADADAMRKINPLGRVPSLILDDGEVLIDSAAILDHLDEVAGRARALMTADGAERRRALHITAIATGALDKAIALSFERLLRPKATQHPPFIARNLEQLRSALDALEAVPKSPWVLGAHLTHADIAIGCLIGYLRLRAPDALEPDRHSSVFALAAAFEASPAFIAARPSDAETLPSN